MATITLRSTKGSPLTIAEVDSNFSNLNTYKLEITSATGSAKLPVGTTAQQDATPSAGWLRFNSTTTQAELYNGTAWASVGGATLSDDVSTNAPYYLTLATATSGTALSLKVSSTKLSFNPSTGTLSSTVFSGSGASLTALNASNLSTGTVGAARLGSGTASTSTYLRGDSSWSALAAGDITSGTMATARLGSGTASTSTYLRGDSSWSALAAGDIASGTMATARLGSGTADATTYLRGDQTWATIVSGASLANDTTTNSTYYPIWATATTGTPTTVYVSNTKLYFNPSTGTLNATNFNSLSDLTLKQNVVKVGNATATVKQIDGVEFEWKDSSKKSAGVIAQQLEEILPHLVDTSAEGIKSVNYSGIVAYLIESVKELDARVRMLEAK